VFTGPLFAVTSIYLGRFCPKRVAKSLREEWRSVRRHTAGKPLRQNYPASARKRGRRSRHRRDRRHINRRKLTPSSATLRMLHRSCELRFAAASVIGPPIPPRPGLVMWIVDREFLSVRPGFTARAGCRAARGIPIGGCQPGWLDTSTATMDVSNSINILHKDPPDNDPWSRSWLCHFLSCSSNYYSAKRQPIARQ
jgi:hypothetical protein